MTDLFMGFIDFVRGSVNDLPTIQAELGFLGTMIDAIHLVIDFVASANFIIPVPDMILCLSAIYIIKTVRIVWWAGNWVVKRIFDLF